MSLSKKVKSLPRPAPERRLPTIYDTVQSYMGYGTQPAAPSDIGYFNNIRHNLARTSQVTPAAAYYSGWVEYELAMAKHIVRPNESFHHFVRAARLLEFGKHHREGASEAALRTKNVSLIRLLGSRFDESERTHRLNQRATVREMGTLAVGLVEQCRDDRISRQERRELIGALSEALVAGVCLTSGEESGEDTLIPAPASPRQDRPRGKGVIKYKDAIAGIQLASAIDYNLLDYQVAASETQPSFTIPTQVKTKERITNEGQSCYVPSVLVLYADRDLFAESFTEFHNLGLDLVEYGRGNATSKRLEDARANVHLAVELFLNPPDEPEAA